MSTFKRISLLVLLVFGTALAGCSATTEVVTPTQSNGSLVAVDSVIVACGDKFFEFADQLNGDAQGALMKTAEWLATQPNVLSATPLDSLFIDIGMKSGLRTGFSIDLIGQDGLSETRGGGNSESGSKLREILGENSTNTIRNKKVLIFAAEESFYAPGELDRLKQRIEDADLGLQVTVLEGPACNYLQLSTFKDFGLVIIETHGMPEGFLMGSTQIDPDKWFTDQGPIPEADFGALIDEAAGPGTYEKIKAGVLEYTGSLDIKHMLPGWQKNAIRPKRDIWVTTTYFTTLPDMPNTVIFGNMCYSGYTAALPHDVPIATAFVQKKPIAYFGYALNNGTSKVVSNTFAKMMDDSLTKSLHYDLDSTGIAHLTDGGSLQTDPYRPQPLATTLRQFGAVDYSYEKDCVDSVKDERDGQVYKTVCIGGQVWMKENLNYDYPGSTTYGGDPSNGAIYGRLYSYAMLDGICPKHWHVPTEEDFNLLDGSVGEPSGGKLKSTSTLWSSPNKGATNASGFGALPGGVVVDISDPLNMSSGIGMNAIFAMKLVDQGIWENRGLLYDSQTFDYFQASSFNEGVSCRCVKDK